MSERPLTLTTATVRSGKARRSLRVGVVGGGIMGLCVAWALARHGNAVTLIEQADEIPNPLAASGDRHRMTRYAYGAWDGYASRMPEADGAWDELWQDLGRSHAVATGLLVLSRQRGDGGDELRDGLERMRTPYCALTPRAAAERYPFLDPDGLRYALFCQRGGVLLCRPIAQGIAAWLRAADAAILLGAKAMQVDAESGRVALTDGTLLAFDRLVVAAGAWAIGLLPELEDRLTIHRTASAYLDPPADLASAWTGAPAIADIGGPAGAYVLPPVRGAGLKIGASVHRRPCPDPEADRLAGPKEGASLLAHLAGSLVRTDAYRVRRVVTCAYTFTADQRFLAIPRERLLILSACSGHGYKFAAAIGLRVARALNEGDSSDLVRWLRADEP